MPLNILLADDSVPAQNMGKKILVDAGYEVQTVSNGLEALRKIAEAAPDIAILDIFMPGYTGLEICERLRGNADTASLPVILTVGKLEPFRPEDGERVRSNAVVVKPFAAAELVAAVRSLIGTPTTKAAGGSASAGASPRQNLAASAPSPQVIDLAASATEESAGSSHSSKPDEPIFDSGQAAMQDEELFGSNCSEGLAFNPDAKHTAFRASAFDDLPPTSSHYGTVESAFSDGEFVLEPAPAPCGSAPELEIQVEQESPLSKPATPEASRFPAGSGLKTVQPRFSGIAEPDAAELEVIILDAAPAVVSATDIAAPSSVGEEAEVNLDLLPSLASLSDYPSDDVEPDSEFELSMGGNEDSGHAETPSLAKEERPETIASSILKRDPLLEDSQETEWAANKSVEEAAETGTADSIDECTDLLPGSIDLISSVPLEAVVAAPYPVDSESQEIIPEVVSVEDPQAMPEVEHAESELVLPEPAVEHLEPEPAPELKQPEAQIKVVESISPSPELIDEEKINQAVDRVFGRFKKILVKAIMRELARKD